MGGDVPTRLDQPSADGAAGQSLAPSPDRAERERRRFGFDAYQMMAAEVITAIGAAGLSVQLSRSIAVDPMSRVGQVSGVAALDLRFLLLGLVVIVACGVAGWRGGRAWPAVRRVACAAVAGLTTGLVAGGILLALRGTDWPLFANWGDSGQLIRWADDLVAGRPVPADYPPVAIYATAWFAELTGCSTAEALRTMQIAGTAAVGPIGYLCWRLLLPPGWALAVTLLATLPVLEPYKPYTTLVLVALVPLLIFFFGRIRRAATMDARRVVVVGMGTGAALGVLFCTYSGWFLWSAPGALAAVLAVYPWRGAPWRAFALIGLAGATLAAVAAPHLIGLIAAAGSVQDRYFYFDTAIDPAYFAMWRNDLPGDPGPWPPPGELAGVGMFLLVLVVGLGLAIALGGRRTPVVTLGALLAGAWLLRLWLASEAYATGAVQLYPRTSAEILYCLLLLSVLAVRYGLRWAADRWPARDGDGRCHERAAGTAAIVGGLAAALLLGLSIGSSVADRYQPRNDGSVGLLAYVAQLVRQPDGTCPDYGHDCAPTVGELLSRGR
jgi:galactan 5-O-arabinofuranosyltransferase